MGTRVSIPHRNEFNKKRLLTATTFKQNVKEYEKQSSSAPVVATVVKETEEPRLSIPNNLNPSLLCFSTTQLGEDDRMNSNHFALKALFEGNILDTVQNNIDFNSSSIKVLDIGCGSGSWVMDMATEFPSVQFTGVDQVVLFPHDIRPANVTFQIHDVLLGLPFEDHSFDFVQMRLFFLAFNRSQWTEALNEAYRVTKPGGYIQLLEVQLVDPGDEVVQAFVEKVGVIMKNNDRDLDICTKLFTLLLNAGFTPIEQVRKSIPLQNHVLSAEFMYIIDISMESCKRFIFEIFDIQEECDFQHIKKAYMESRRTTSESAWYCAVGQKPLESL